MSDKDAYKLNKIYEAIRKTYGYDREAEALLDLLDDMSYAYEMQEL